MTEPKKTDRSPIPVLVAALICDAAALDRTTGKKTLVGIFDRLYVRAFPTLHPMALYLKLADAEGNYKFQVKMVHRDTEEVLATVNAEITVKDRLLSNDFYMDADSLPFPRPGRYEFQVWANDIYLGAVFIDAVLAPTQG